jgi:diaminopimelate epimerase
VRFAKGHGTENDFVVIFDPDDSYGLTPALAAALCNRRTGIGGDGVLRAVRTDEPGSDGWFMDYRNSDGSLAEMCGNGIRVFARYLLANGLVASPEFTVATRAGLRRLWPAENGDITVDMGRVTGHGPGHAVVAGESLDGLKVWAGNPHLACLVSRPPAEYDLSRPPVLSQEDFPDGANLELLQVTGPRSLRMRVYERGSGETRSCGTGAVAAAAAVAVVQGKEEGSWQVTVPGGTLRVVLQHGIAWLTGPAVLAAGGVLDPAWLAAVERPSPQPAAR